MATGGEKPENSDPATTSAATAVAGDDKRDHVNNGKTPPTSSSGSSESSWGEEPPPEATTAATVDSKSSQAVTDPDAYRIPSEVFSRTKSSPMDWSVASNESLFSINTGNMSFAKEHTFMFAKSDLGYDRTLSMGGLSPMRDLPPLSPAMTSKPSSPKKSNETAPLISNGISPSVGDSESGVVNNGSTREVIKEKQSSKKNHDAGTMAGSSGPIQVGKDPSFEKSSSLRRSSTASVKSFAFPILTAGDGQHRSTQSQSQPPTPQAATQLEPATPRSDNNDNNNNKSPQPTTPRSADNKENRNGTSGGGQGSKWFSCLPCCPSPTSS
ncbi:hypothetical protein LINPERPRIM_LOCUS23237 [Linum perenne]